MPLFTTYCTSCHGLEKQKGDLTLHNIEAKFIDGAQLERWRMIEEQIRFREMPPEKEKQPTAAERERALAWIRTQLLRTQQPDAMTDSRLLLPEFGNRVDHEALFTAPAGSVIPTAPRLWRLRPETYQANMISITEGVEGLSRPFSMRSKPGIRDYAALYFVDEPATDLLLRNAERVVSKTMIMEHVWDYHFDPQTNVVESRIYKLREKVDRGYDPKLIHTLRLIVYFLIQTS